MMVTGLTISPAGTLIHKLLDEKLILVISKKADFLRYNSTDYFFACEEVGCDGRGVTTAFLKSLISPQEVTCQKS
jgi:hypothetical protein